MGVWNGYNDTIDHPGLQAEMREVIKPWYTAQVQILDPKFIDDSYDPEADLTTDVNPESIMWDSGPNGALVQPLLPRIDRRAGEEAQIISTIQVQTSLPRDVSLRAGLRLKVIDGGNFPQLEEGVWAIQEGLAGSLAWGALITCTALTR